MGMAMSLAHNVFTPLVPLFSWLFSGGLRTPSHGNAPDRTLGVAAKRSVTVAPVQHGVAPSRPLRVVRVADSGRFERGGGRIVISGRMADVCAELDRLAALESRLH